MARLVGVDLPRDKRLEIGLTYIYGIGLTTSQKILKETGVNPDMKCDELTEEDLSKLRDLFSLLSTSIILSSILSPIIL